MQIKYFNIRLGKKEFDIAIYLINENLVAYGDTKFNDILINLLSEIKKEEEKEEIVLLTNWKCN